MEDENRRAINHGKGTGCRYFVLSILVFTFILFGSRLTAATADLPFFNYDALISMDFQDVSLKDLLKVFSIESGINFIASEAVQDRLVTLYFDKVPIKDAMDKLFQANNLSYEYDPLSNIILVKDWGRPEVEKITKVYNLKHAIVKSSAIEKSAAKTVGETGGGTEEEEADDVGIAPAVRAVLSSQGTLIEDPRTNSLIITDIPSHFPIIEDTLRRLDVPVPQVMLEVEMLDVSKNLVDKFGFEFDNNPITLIVPGQFRGFGPPFYFGDAADRGAEGGVTISKKYANILDLLRTQTDAKYLARPRILTLHNETAEIKIATNESIGVKVEVTEDGISSEAERHETGVIFKVTPVVSQETGEITMYIIPQVSESLEGNTLTSSGLAFKYRDPEIRSTSSKVRVKDGDTIIVGGLIRNELAQTTKKVPFFGDLPVVGAFFRHKDKTRDRERELLVFITPRIIKDGQFAYAKTGTQNQNMLSLEREQQLPAYGMQRKRSIDSYLDSFER